jgi:hypothetical protein
VILDGFLVRIEDLIRRGSLLVVPAAHRVGV